MEFTLDSVACMGACSPSAGDARGRRTRSAISRAEDTRKVIRDAMRGVGVQTAGAARRPAEDMEG